MDPEQTTKNNAKQVQAEESSGELEDSQLKEVTGGTGDGEGETLPRENIHPKEG